MMKNSITDFFSVYFCLCHFIYDGELSGNWDCFELVFTLACFDFSKIFFKKGGKRQDYKKTAKKSKSSYHPPPRSIFFCTHRQL